MIAFVQKLDEKIYPQNQTYTIEHSHTVSILILQTLSLNTQSVAWDKSHWIKIEHSEQSRRTVRKDAIQSLPAHGRKIWEESTCVHGFFGRKSLVVSLFEQFPRVFGHEQICTE